MSNLYVVATPIGNLEDISYRAVRILSTVEICACEDTRHTRIIFDHYSIPYPRVMFAYHEHNEAIAAFQILRHLQNGKDVAICSNAGSPSLSDPGYRAIALAIQNNIPVVVVPGPHAAAMAVVGSGLPVSSYTFLGFPPRKTGQRKNFFMAEKENPHSLLMYESPNRVVDLCVDALEVLGDRSACVCFELTKKFERFERGYLSDIITRLQESVTIKGEITVVIAGKNKKFIRVNDPSV